MGGGGGGGRGGGETLDPESQMALQRSHKAIDDLEERGMAMLGVCVCVCVCLFSRMPKFHLCTRRHAGTCDFFFEVNITDAANLTTGSLASQRERLKGVTPPLSPPPASPPPSLFPSLSLSRVLSLSLLPFPLPPPPHACGASEERRLGCTDALLCFSCLTLSSVL